eukprot:scaffold85604_cov20-Tisochrysis_lutea.AAC.1
MAENQPGMRTERDPSLTPAYFHMRNDRGASLTGAVARPGGQPKACIDNDMCVWMHNGREPAWRVHKERSQPDACMHPYVQSLPCAVKYICASNKKDASLMGAAAKMGKKLNACMHPCLCSNNEASITSAALTGLGNLPDANMHPRIQRRSKRNSAGGPVRAGAREMPASDQES